jgi:flagellar biosynthetic protein FliR
MGTADFLAALLGQLVFGLALGFAVLAAFSAARAAGEFVDNLTGSTLSVVFDPLSGAASPVFGRFFQLAFTACFFALNGHLLLAAGFRRSFEALPLINGLVPGRLAGSAGVLVSQLVVMSLEIAGPLIVALFLVEVALGLLARAAPTLNVLVLGLGVKALLSVLLVIAFAPAIPGLTARLVDRIGAAMTIVARAFS